MGIPMLKIRRPVGRLIFNMGIAIPSKMVFLIETAPRSFQISLKTTLYTVDQLMRSTIVHHIPRWRESSPLRDFMRRLWTCTLWNVDCLHANWLIRCIWIAVSVVFKEINAHPVCIVDDKIPLGCGGRQTRVARMMWWTIIWDVGDDICPLIYIII